MVAIRAANDRIYWQRNRLTPAEPLQHHAHTLTCRHAGEFQIVAGESVPRVLDLHLLATSEEIPFWYSNRAVDLFLAQLLNHDVSEVALPVRCSNWRIISGGMSDRTASSFSTRSGRATSRP
jgi:hypothetical protein